MRSAPTNRLSHNLNVKKQQQEKMKRMLPCGIQGVPIIMDTKTNTPHPSEVVGSLIPIVSEPWEVECKGTWHAFPEGSKGRAILEQGGVFICSICHCTGTRTVRLVGYIDTGNMGGIPIHPLMLSGKFNYKLSEQYAELYRAGTLPESVTRWLWVEEVTP